MAPPGGHRSSLRPITELFLMVAVEPNWGKRLVHLIKTWNFSYWMNFSFIKWKQTFGTDMAPRYTDFHGKNLMSEEWYHACGPHFCSNAGNKTWPKNWSTVLICCCTSQPSTSSALVFTPCLSRRCSGDNLKSSDKKKIKLVLSMFILQQNCIHL